MLLTVVHADPDRVIRIMKSLYCRHGEAYVSAYVICLVVISGLVCSEVQAQGEAATLSLEHMVICGRSLCKQPLTAAGVTMLWCNLATRIQLGCKCRAIRLVESFMTACIVHASWDQHGIVMSHGPRACQFQLTDD